MSCIRPARPPAEPPAAPAAGEVGVEDSSVRPVLRSAASPSTSLVIVLIVFPLDPHLHSQFFAVTSECWSTKDFT